MTRRAALVVASAATLTVAAPLAFAAPPTIVANPSVLGGSATLQLQGVVPGAGAGETVTIEAKSCADTFFRVFAGATTTAGGSWSYAGTTGLAYVRANTRFRARAKGELSEAVLVRRRASVTLTRMRNGLLRAGVFAEFQNLHGKSIRLERYTGSQWVLVRAAKLRKDAYGFYLANFRVARHGLQLRATVAEAAVRPCYAAGVSSITRS